MDSLIRHLSVLTVLLLPVASVFGEQTLSADDVDDNLIECGCNVDASSTADSPESWRLLGECGLRERFGINISGHIQQGVTTNSRNPTNPPVGSGNMPATLYNHRNDEYMLNQMLLRVTRKTDNGGCGWDIGGHMDLLYGTDYIFLQSRGLETEHDFSNRWNSSNGSGIDGNGLMGLALPQLNLEVAYDDLTFTLGHFYEPLGYERPVPTDNFYYSTTYGYNFSFETSQVTRAMVQWQANDRWSFTGGFHRGMLNWEDNNNDLNAFAGFTYVPAGKDASLQFFSMWARKTTPERRFAICTASRLARRWAIAGATSSTATSAWSSRRRLAVKRRTGTTVAQWLAYQIDPRWTVRYEWFDGDPGVGPGPFGNGTKRSLFMGAVDVILAY